MAKAGKAGSMDRIRDAARRTAKRSSLYNWMRANYAEFSSLMDEVGRPDWKALTEAFKQEGLSGSRGAELRSEAARLTWWKVRRDVEASSRRRSVAKAPDEATRQTKPMTDQKKESKPGEDVGPGSLAWVRQEMRKRSGRSED